MSVWYVLDEDHIPHPTGNLDEYARQQGDLSKRRVALTDLDDIGDGVSVSTVFLGLDHGWGGGAPVLFETMVFHDGDGRECWRYCTWDAAAAGHELVVAAVRAGEPLDDLTPLMGGGR